MALSLVLLTQCAGASSSPAPVVVVNPCGKIRVAEYTKDFQARLADEMSSLPPEAQKAIIDAGLTRADVRACRDAR